MQKRPNKRTSVMDIEHVPVPDDPRTWSYSRKTLTLAIVSSVTTATGFATTVQNPANAQIEQDLHVSSSDVSWSISLFILVQGLFPLVWSAISEINGRKIVYIASISLFVLGSAGAATSNSIGLLIGMRVVQAVGSSAVMSIGSATLADIYEPHERGTKMGIYYSAPLLGASISPFLGGILTQAFGWRAVFWFTLVAGGVVLVSLVLFEDTFRKERSLAYQTVLCRNLKQSQLSESSPGQTDIPGASTDTLRHVPSEKTVDSIEVGMAADPLRVHDVILSFIDINPFQPVIVVLRQWNNIAILLASGLIFGFTSSLMYTCAITLSARYQYDALYTGVILLCYGAGSTCGSIFGGQWSDRTLMRLKSQHGQKVFTEARLRSTFPVMLGLPLSAIAYAWICQTHQAVAGVCVMLFSAGFCAAWMYSSTLAYIVDANVGRSSTAVAVNSAYRGILAFTAIEIAIPLQDSIGDGGLYTFWGGMLIVVNMLVLMVFKFGRGWRERGEAEEQLSNSH